MPETVLISFMGKGQRADGGQGGAKSGYRTATYRFAGGEPVTTTFFGWALWQHLRRRTGKKPTRWVVLGTGQSSWSTLADCATDDSAGCAFLELVTDGDATQSALDQGAPLVGPALDARDLRLRVIGDCSTAAMQRGMFNTLEEVLGQDDRVILDVTHGYRHLPVLLAFQLQVLRRTRGVRVAGMFYGALDMKDASGEAPVVDLSVCADYADAAAALATYETTGNYRELAALVPEARAAAQQAAFFEAINHTTRGRRFAGEAAKACAKAPPSAASKALCASMEWCAENRFYQRMLARGEMALEHGDYLKSSLLIFESIVSWGIARSKPAASQGQYEEEDRESAFGYLRDYLGGVDRQTFAILRAVRNSVAHGTTPTGADTQQVLGDEGRTRGFLYDAVKLARRCHDDGISPPPPA